MFENNKIINDFKGIISNPKQVDWRTKGIIGPSANQYVKDAIPTVVADLCSSVLAMQKQTNYTALSFAQIYDCYSQSQKIEDGYGYVLQYGLEFQQDYQQPFNACMYNASKVQYKPVNITQVAPNDLDALESAVASTPVSVKVDATNWQFYSGGVLRKCGNKTNHDALIIGYNSTDSYWILKNYWGTQWGENGYINVMKQTGKGQGICGEATQAYYPN